MKARDVLRRLTRRFGLLVALVVVGGGAGAVYAAVKTPTYTAKAYVVTIGGESITALNYAQAYGRIAASGPILATAATKLGGDRTGLDQVTASTSPDAPVVEIVATGPSASRTADVANAVANSLIALGDTRKPDTGVGMALLAAATPPAKPTSPKPPMELAIGAAAGLLIGGLVMLSSAGRKAAVPAEQKAREQSGTTHYRTTYTQTEEQAGSEVERWTGVWRSKQPVITAVPEQRTAPDPPVRVDVGAEPDDADDDEPQESAEAAAAAAEAPADLRQKVRIVGRAIVFPAEGDKS